jgi:hypothetical protein
MRIRILMLTIIAGAVGVSLPAGGARAGKVFTVPRSSFSMPAGTGWIAAAVKPAVTAAIPVCAGITIAATAAMASPRAVGKLSLPAEGRRAIPGARHRAASTNRTAIIHGSTSAIR